MSLCGRAAELIIAQPRSTPYLREAGCTCRAHCRSGKDPNSAYLGLPASTLHCLGCLPPGPCTRGVPQPMCTRVLAACIAALKGLSAACVPSLAVPWPQSNAADLLFLADLWCLTAVKARVLACLRRTACNGFRWGCVSVMWGEVPSPCPL